MPQLSQIGEIYASQFFWLAIVFALIYFGIGKAMVPRIERTMDDRAHRISGDLAAAEAAREAARSADEGYQRELESARQTASRSIVEAQARATAATEAQLKTSDAEAASRVDAAVGRIEAAKAHALDEIEAATVEAAAAIVAKLTGTAPEHAAVARQVKAELAHG
jgi:F-type H+-transporting ATPase subunit b